MIVIHEWKFLWLFVTLWIFYSGYSDFAEPLVKILRRKEFDFAEAMADTTSGIVFMVIGAVATLLILNQ